MIRRNVSGVGEIMETINKNELFGSNINLAIDAIQQMDKRMQGIVLGLERTGTEFCRKEMGFRRVKRYPE